MRELPWCLEGMDGWDETPYSLEYHEFYPQAKYDQDQYDLDCANEIHWPDQ